MRRSNQLALVIAASWFLLVTVPAQAEVFENDKLKIYGDFRTRVEADFESQQADGIARNDRNRIRIRARLGMNYSLDGPFSFGIRIRSGSDANHQSGHITLVDLDDNDTGDVDFNLDTWFLKANGKNSWGWAGRNSLPFWKQNDMLWDSDATVSGLAVGYSRKTGDQGSLAFNAGYFSLPVGMKEFTGNLLLGQAVFATRAGGADWTVAGGLLSIESNASDPDAAILLRGNGLRDYSVVTASVQTVFTFHGRPLSLGVDLYHNAENYSDTDPDPVTAGNHDQTDGYVLAVKYGDTREKGHWLVGWWFANVEALAIHSSYAQDDWVRWGSSSETRATDLEGHELRFAYALRNNVNMVAKLFSAESITTIEDGRRFRVDCNYKF